MSKRDLRRVFSMLNRGNQRRFQLTQPDPNEELIQELVGMTANLAAIKTLIEVVEAAKIDGSAVQRVAQGMFFLQGMRTGTEARVKEIEAKLPKTSPVVQAPPPEILQPEVKAGEPVLAGASQ